MATSQNFLTKEELDSIIFEKNAKDDELSEKLDIIFAEAITTYPCYTSEQFKLACSGGYKDRMFRVIRNKISIGG